MIELNDPNHELESKNLNPQENKEKVQSMQNDFITNFPYEKTQIPYKYKHNPHILIDVDQKTLDYLVSSSLVKSIYEERHYRLSLDSSVPLIGAPVAFNLGFDGSGQTIAILDTGVEKTHSFLNGKVVSEACFSTTNIDGNSLCPNGQNEQIGSGAAVPCTSHSGCFHGTHVAGIAAGNGSTFTGVAKNATIIAIQVFRLGNTTSSCENDPIPCLVSSSFDQEKALEHVYDLRNNFSIASVNLSLGEGNFTTICDTQFSNLKSSVSKLHDVGIVTIAASGNEGNKTGINSPACISNVVSVGATIDEDDVWSDSNSANILDLLAPGVSIQSSIPGNDDFGSVTGTSQAAPHVAGAWAILKQQMSYATVDTILSKLKDTGKPILDNNISKPLIQLDKAITINFDRIFLNIPIDETVINPNERLVLLDTTELGTIRHAFIAANLPCNSGMGPIIGANNDFPDLYIIAANMTHSIGVISSSVDSMEVSVTGNLCMFRDDVNPSSNLSAITSIILTNNGTSSVTVPAGSLVTVDGTIETN